MLYHYFQLEEIHLISKEIDINEGKIKELHEEYSTIKKDHIDLTIQVEVTHINEIKGHFK